MSETATETPSPAPPTDQLAGNMDKMKIEQNGVPAGDTGMPAAPVTPAPAQPASPQPASTAPPAAEAPACPPPSKQPPKEESKPEIKEQNTQQPSNLKQMFKAFSKFGDLKSDGKFITLSQR